MSINPSKEQIRNQKVLEAIKTKGRVTIGDLAQYLKLGTDQTFYGRKLKLILADLTYSKKLKVTTGKNPSYSVISKEKPKLLDFDLQAELDAVAPKPTASGFGPGKKITPIARKESKVIPLTRPEPQIAPYPVIGNLAQAPQASPPISQQVSSEEAFKIFDLAFSKNPDKTLDTLVKVVFEQQRKLERQEKLIKSLHKLLGEYLAG